MYIVFEWIVGSWKSTQSKLLAEYFRELWKEVIHVREPGWTPISEDIRTLAQWKIWENEEMHPITNAYLYAAARAQLLHTVVKPALEAWKIVISDRSFLSSCAYQWEAQWLWIETIFEINWQAVNRVTPTHIIYMQADLEKSLSRTFDSSWDKWETKWKEFFEKVLVGYEKSLEAFSIKNSICDIIKIDANWSIDEVSDKIRKNFK